MNHHLVIGKGPWGHNIAETLLHVDPGSPQTIIGRDFTDVVEWATHVYIATPLSTHLDVLKQVLAIAGKRVLHLWLEKPAFQNEEEMDEAYKVLRPDLHRLFVDHTLCFNEGVHRLLDYVKERDDVVTQVDIELGKKYPERPDCHYALDWGAHAVAAALLLTVGNNRLRDVANVKAFNAWDLNHTSIRLETDTETRKPIININVRRVDPMVRSIAITTALNGVVTFDDAGERACITYPSCGPVLYMPKYSPLESALRHFLGDRAVTWAPGFDRAVQRVLDAVRRQVT